MIVVVLEPLNFGKALNWGSESLGCYTDLLIASYGIMGKSLHLCGPQIPYCRIQMGMGSYWYIGWVLWKQMLRYN